LAPIAFNCFNRFWSMRLKIRCRLWAEKINPAVAKSPDFAKHSRLYFVFTSYLYFAERSQQTRFDGSTHMQHQEIPALCGKKTERFSPSFIPKSREELRFFKSLLLRHQKLVFKPSKFYKFELQLKNKPRLEVTKRGCFFMIFDFF